MNNVYLAFLLTFLAGLTTSAGSLIAFVTKTTSRRSLSVALGFSAGVMIYVSMSELFPIAREYISSDVGEILGGWIVVLSFFSGIILIAVIDSLIPSYENPHEIHNVEEMTEKTEHPEFNKLKKTGVMVALALAIHSFPEGLTTFMAAIQDPKLGVAIAIAIAIHNIPEGISVSVPIYYATKSKRKAFIYSTLSGLTEPVGAILGYLVLRPFISNLTLGITFAFIAGIMIFVSLDELLPSAREYGEHHFSIYGLVLGMAVMAVSLLILQTK